MNVALYARYSTNLQDKTSITGQFRNCEQFCTQHGFAIVSRFKDEGITGTADDRPGFQDLMAAAERGDFDGIIVDETSRLTRTSWMLGKIVEQLSFRDQFVCDSKGAFDSRQQHSELLAGLLGHS